MAIKKIEIKKFLNIEELEISCVKGINVFIGENGTGKTHLLKSMYAILADNNSKKITKERLEDYFGIKDQNFDSNSIIIEKTNSISVFIPAKDMLTHAKGLIEMSKKYQKEMPFDKSILDIIEKAKQWKLDKVPEIGKNILPKLEKIMDGKVILEDDTFYIQKNNGKKVDFIVEAEGYKKIGVLWQLIMNENICPGSVLIWDEPEANLNPKNLKCIAEVLIELSNNNVQIFIATHNYYLAKYLEILIEETENIKFNSLYKINDKIKCETADKFSLLHNNYIIDENIKVYDTELNKEFDL